MKNAKEQVDLYNNTYGKFTDPVLAEVRNEAFGKDIGQNSWITASEMERFLLLLNVGPANNLLEIACGSGGPALFIAETLGCSIWGVDSNENGITTARQSVSQTPFAAKVRFEVADVDASLPFENESFDAIVCTDAINHFMNRVHVLNEWQRVLKRGGRFLYTDPIVVSGALTNEEMSIRSSIGFFLFVPVGCNEQWIEQSGFRIVHQEDVTSDAATIAKRWHDARERREKELTPLEGEDRFKGLQLFFEVVHRLYNERRLSRIAYVGEKL
jgi:SAM-dependent methyltransferase